MAKFEFEYTGPNIGIDGKSELDDLGRYGRLCLSYLHEQKPGMYRKLAEHCTMMDKITFEMAEWIRAVYLKKHPMPENDTMERIHLSEQTQEIADKIVIAQIICI